MNARCPRCKSIEYKIVEDVSEKVIQVIFECNLCKIRWTFGTIGLGYIDGAQNRDYFRHIYPRIINIRNSKEGIGLRCAECEDSTK